MDSLLNNLLDWMQTNNLRLCSFDRVIASVSGASTYDQIAAEIRANPSIFRPANIKGVGPGLALVDTYRFVEATPAPALNVNDLSASAGIATGPIADVNGPIGYAIPAVTPCAPIGYNDTVSQDQPAPTTSVLTPKESVEKLIRLAAEADVSGSSLNYANAAVAAATALQLLDDAR